MRQSDPTKEPGKYRKKPVVIEAMRLESENGGERTKGPRVWQIMIRFGRKVRLS